VSWFDEDCIDRVGDFSKLGEFAQHENDHSLCLCLWRSDDQVD